MGWRSVNENGPLARISSTNSAGVSESVSVRQTDAGGLQDYDLYIEIRYFPTISPTCGDWTLTITGNTTSGTVGTCNG